VDELSPNHKIKFCPCAISPVRNVVRKLSIVVTSTVRHLLVGTSSSKLSSSCTFMNLE